MLRLVEVLFFMNSSGKRRAKCHCTSITNFRHIPILNHTSDLSNRKTHFTSPPFFFSYRVVSHQ